jgi:hypothetical protein
MGDSGLAWWFCLGFALVSRVAQQKITLVVRRPINRRGALPRFGPSYSGSYSRTKAVPTTITTTPNRKTVSLAALTILDDLFITLSFGCPFIHGL